MDYNRSRDLFGDYFDSIYKASNVFTKEQYIKNSAAFDSIYGKFLPSDKNSVILDIGSGTGQFISFLKDKGYTNLKGIDLSPSQVEYCKANVFQNVEVADGLDYLAGKENTFDIITANDVVEHLPKEKIIPFLRLVYAALKPGGSFLSKVPNMGNPFALTIRYKDFTHEVGFTDMSYYQVLYLSGFRDIELNQSLSFLTLKDKLLMKPFLKLVYFIMMKLYWYQGFVAPTIMSPLIVAGAKK